MILKEGTSTGRMLIRTYEIEAQEEYKKSLVTNKGPLKLFFNQQVLDKYIYLDMMRYKVKEILFCGDPL